MRDPQVETLLLQRSVGTSSFGCVTRAIGRPSARREFQPPCTSIAAQVNLQPWRIGCFGHTQGTSWGQA